VGALIFTAAAFLYWWIISGVAGKVNGTLTVLVLVGAGSFVVGAAVSSRRS
jgi:hypothetical protein